ncbi:MAG: hypothetical protein VYE46_05030 [Cyanobacteriota bacterium]|nr:hypothetical protein [Cyanobacteriota bacterium]
MILDPSVKSTQFRRSTAIARSEVQPCVLAGMAGTQDSPFIVVRTSNRIDWDTSN